MEEMLLALLAQAEKLTLTLVNCLTFLMCVNNCAFANMLTETLKHRATSETQHTFFQQPKREGIGLMKCP